LSSKICLHICVSAKCPDGLEKDGARYSTPSAQVSCTRKNSNSMVCGQRPIDPPPGLLAPSPSPLPLSSSASSFLHVRSPTVCTTSWVCQNIQETQHCLRFEISQASSKPEIDLLDPWFSFSPSLPHTLPLPGRNSRGRGSITERGCIRVVAINRLGRWGNATEVARWACLIPVHARLTAAYLRLSKCLVCRR
jgi:hypothetical protein